jgi:hypothetical protein
MEIPAEVTTLGSVATLIAPTLQSQGYDPAAPVHRNQHHRAAAHGKPNQEGHRPDTEHKPAQPAAEDAPHPDPMPVIPRLLYAPA